MSLRFVPENDQLSDAKNTQFGPAAPSAPGLVDTLRSGEPPLSVSSKVNNRHPLESRLEKWDQAQRDLQLETYRRMFGAADPIKREMELSIVQESDFKPQLFANSAITSPSEDILLNRESTVGWEDIYNGSNNVRENDFHAEMEKKMGI
ncbi:DEKNAAE105250 [Brettanomyces naardenensis]|uniref:DEKNAAE105251 n=1 Tax=Brettanomyces naardenensis TaxID=13370 RepID=A0A448YSR6_BRENA|nr:DEKNAAE105250 [Brettanomyces naardenensis]